MNFFGRAIQSKAYDISSLLRYYLIFSLPFWAVQWISSRAIHTNVQDHINKHQKFDRCSLVDVTQRCMSHITICHTSDDNDKSVTCQRIQVDAINEGSTSNFRQRGRSLLTVIFFFEFSCLSSEIWLLIEVFPCLLNSCAMVNFRFWFVHILNIIMKTRFIFSYYLFRKMLNNNGIQTKK